MSDRPESLPEPLPEPPSESLMTREMLEVVDSCEPVRCLKGQRLN